MKTYQIVAIAALFVGALTIFGAMGTWAEIQSGLVQIDVQGTDTDRGIDFIVVGAIIFVLGFVAFVPTTGWRAISGFGMIAVGAFCLYWAYDTKSTIGELVGSSEASSYGVYTSFGPGLSLLIVAGIIGIIAGIAILIAASKEESTFVSRLPASTYSGQ